MAFEPSAITVWISLLFAETGPGQYLEIVIFGYTSEDSGSKKVPQN